MDNDFDNPISEHERAFNEMRNRRIQEAASKPKEPMDPEAARNTAKDIAEREARILSLADKAPNILNKNGIHIIQSSYDQSISTDYTNVRVGGRGYKSVSLSHVRKEGAGVEPIPGSTNRTRLFIGLHTDEKTR